jgi:hypothetical protein
MRSESVQRRGGIVRERRIRAAREHGGVGPSEQRSVGCAPEIDAAMDRVQDAAAHPVCDGATPDAKRRELTRRDDAVLSCRHPPDQQIHMHNCRIEIVAADLRQNCTAYVQFCRRS